MGFIYCIKNKVNGKLYVGLTKKPIETRFKEHLASSKSSWVIHRAIRKYGKDNFDVSMLGEFPDCDLADAERTFISELGTMIPNGYNMTEGGDGISGYSHTEETKEILRNSTRRVMSSLSQEELASRADKISKALKGRKFSIEHRHKISEQAKKRVGVLNPNYGKKLSEERRKSMSDSRTGIPNLAKRVPVRCEGVQISKDFESFTEASNWLIDNGLSRSKNVSSITTTIQESVKSNCLRYGFRWFLVV